MKPAIFFDRDGIINVDKGYVYRIEDFEWIVGSRETIRWFNDKGFWVFVVTNQSGVARGYYSERDITTLHHWIDSELNAFGAHIDDYYYCPHHPQAVDANYRLNCNCRKPASGLIERAFLEWPIDKERSILIGDKMSDIIAANNAGIKGYLFKGNNLFDFVMNLNSHKIFSIK